ncbi:hypothetical protein DMA11_19050 [Marinilabiliaceae bacterium JC017]|nr:hypothetical protein DMA11_19050 [Marinilabiliaceae bacterium JC017]
MLEDYTIQVVFYDPYLNLIEQTPEFEKLDSLRQLEIWDEYLLNNVIFDFQLTQNEKILKHYILKGNPSKTVEKLNLPRNTIYELDIVNHQSNVNYYNASDYQEYISLKIDKLNFYGTLFDKMELIEEMISSGQRLIAYNLFGRHRLPIQYNTVQYSVLGIIADDLYGVIPEEMIAKDEELYNNKFFDYQQCISEYYQIDRIEKIYIRRYNSDGTIQDEFPRIEITMDIKSNLNKMSGILGVTTLPCFHSSDTAILISTTDTTNVYSIKTNNNKAVDKYLQEIIVTKNKNNEISKIEAKRLIHASSIQGDFVIKENYMACFKRFDNKCVLPYLLLSSEIDDKNFDRPKSVIELDYLFYRK